MQLKVFTDNQSPLLLEGLIGGLEHANYAESRAAVIERPLSGRYTIHKVGHLLLQSLTLFNCGAHMSPER